MLRFFCAIAPVISFADEPSQKFSYIDTRISVNQVDEVYEGRIRAGHHHNNNPEFHIEGTQHYRDRIGDNASDEASYLELEADYVYEMDESWTLIPGFVYWHGPDHNEYRPYLKADIHSFDPFFLSGRHRYHFTTNDVNTTSQIDAWIGYTLDSFYFEYNPAYIMQSDVLGEGKNSKWEHVLTFKYTAFTAFTPYFDIQFLDKVAENNTTVEIR